MQDNDLKDKSCYTNEFKVPSFSIDLESPVLSFQRGGDAFVITHDNID
jgi:hypothetical protein